MLYMQAEVLKQVQETGMYKHVVEFLSSTNSCCRSLPILEMENNLPNIAASICRQGAEILAGKSGTLEGYCCSDMCVRCLKANGDGPVTLVSGTVMDGSSKQGLDVLVPSTQTKSSCCGCGPSNGKKLYPAANDILTALVLALPPETWSGIKDEKLIQDIHALASTESLPLLLQEEVSICSFLSILRLFSYADALFHSIIHLLVK